MTTTIVGMAVEGEGSLENGGWRSVYILADTSEVH